jgi:Cache domain
MRCKSGRRIRHRSANRFQQKSSYAAWIAAIAPIVLIVICLSALSALFLLDARPAAWERASDVAARLAAVASDMSHNFETLDLSLQAVVENLKQPGIEQLRPELRNLVLFDCSATARHLGSILVLDEDGNLRFDSRTLTPAPLNVADRDYFQVYKNNDKVGMYISRPLTRRRSQDPAIGISRRLSHADGSFAGVVVGTLRLASLRQLFENVTRGSQSNITLSRSDGILLMRWPYREEYIGFDLKHTELYKHLPLSRSGLFETNSATDNVHRLIYYTQIDDLPLVVGVGQSTAVILTSWNRYAVALGLIIAAFCLSGIALASALPRA